MTPRRKTSCAALLVAALAAGVPVAPAQAQGLSAFPPAAPREPFVPPLDAFPPEAPSPGQPLPAQPSPEQPGPGGQAAPVQAAPPSAPDIWKAASGVDLVGLDKVSGRTTPLSGRTGQELHFGTLTVVARACVVRPPVVAPDAAAFLEITDMRTGSKPFRAWMLLSEPAVSVFEHPVYDIRFMGCRAGS